MAGVIRSTLRKHIPAPVLLPALVILIGLALRIVGLAQADRFHPDEALFATQARLIATQEDWLLRSTDLDKPPLTFYTTAFSFSLFGSGETAARLPNLLFSVLTVAALIMLAGALYADFSTAVLAGLLLALSPFDLAFAATLFTDVQATFWVLFAAWLAASDRWTAAGIAAALIAAAKPNALIALPLIVALGLARNARNEWTWREIVTRLARLMGPLLMGIALLVLWDVARAPRSFWELGWQRNDPGRFIRAGEVWPRLRAWGHWAAFMTGSPVLNGSLFLMAVPWLTHHVLRRPSREAALDALIAAYALAYIGWHWLIAFNTYDRYLHTLTPFALLLAARLLISAWRASRETLHRVPGRRADGAALVLLIALVLPGTLTILRGNAAIGGDQGKHDGIQVLARSLNTLDGAIVYDHWLGWELSYYLGREPSVQLRYTPQPEALVEDLSTTQPAALHNIYFVAPSSQDAALWLVVLHHSRIVFTEIYHDAEHGFVVYALNPPSP